MLLRKLSRWPEQADLHVGDLIHNFTVCLHDTVGYGEFQPAQYEARNFHLVGHGFYFWRHHAGEFDFAYAQCAALAGFTQPAEKETCELPKRIKTEAAGHDGVAVEMAGEKPEIGFHIKFSRDRAQACGAAVFLNVGDPIKHQHGGQRQLRIARAEQFASTTGEQVFVGVGWLWCEHRLQYRPLIGLAGFSMADMEKGMRG
jgi:hypothetical protein